MERNASDLQWILEYEVAQARRHRRFVTLAMCKSKSSINIKRVLADTMRQSDVYFEFGDSLGAIMMGETDQSGARTAIERFKKSCSGQIDLRFAVASYPQDNLAAPGFLPAVYSRLKRAEAEGEAGSVVYAD